MAFCTTCGKPNPDTAKFCIGCGAVLTVKKTTAPVSPAATARPVANPWMIISIIAFIGLAAAGYFLFIKKDKKDSGVTKEEPAATVDTPAKSVEYPPPVNDTTAKMMDTTMAAPRSSESDNYSGIPGRFPQTSERYLTSNDLIGLTQWDLKIMRNEIYARHGYIFQKDDMRQYFTSQSWYQPLYNNVDAQLSAIEKSNIYLIKDFEQ